MVRVLFLFLFLFCRYFPPEKRCVGNIEGRWWWDMPDVSSIWTTTRRGGEKKRIKKKATELEISSTFCGMLDNLCSINRPRTKVLFASSRGAGGSRKNVPIAQTFRIAFSPKENNPRPTLQSICRFYIPQATETRSAKMPCFYLRRGG